MNKKIKYLLVFFCLIIFKSSKAQEKEFDHLLKNRNYKLFSNSIESLISSDSSKYFFYKSKFFLKERNIKEALKALEKVDTLKLSENYKAWYLYVLGDCYRYNNQEEKSFSCKLKAQKLFRNIGNVVMENKINHDLHYTLVSQDFLEYDGNSYLKTFYENARENNLTEQLLTAHLGLSLLNYSELKNEQASFHLDEAKKFAKKINTNEAYYRLYNYSAVINQSYTTDYENAIKFSDSMIHYAKLLNSSNKIESSLKTLAYTYTLQGDYEKAILQLLRADSLSITENVFNRKRKLYEYLALNYESVGRIDSAYSYHKKMVKYKDSINIESQNKILAFLGTSELEQQNLILDKERLHNQNLAYLGLIGFLSLLIVVAIVLMYYRKKKLIAEINARNEEKDKQRQRIAGELHDNLGSLIVAIKQCFENLKMSKDRFLQEENNLMSKARELLEEAYQKIRNMARIENAASDPSEYWIDAVRNFAFNVTESNDLNIEINTYGLEDFINTTLEDDLRRMVIELITNIIKHANAKEVSIEIMHRNNLLNIIVEDDGEGFEITITKEKKGMGLYGIEKKVNELNGKLTIDSKINKGTTIIIDIPV
ncbi:tetratricopeptide repeat-containing sensor histidine kinase [Kordia sp.]|uniref:tetratricopeptide repeat-containing sensor histidine kinase n=1 Tax=Kordia sp. TaxID=1965332 RepID=UPI003D28FDB4